MTILCLLAPTGARANLSISPLVNELDAYPGGSKKFTVGVSNTSDKALDCTIKCSGLEILGSGMPVATDDAARSCSGWIEIKEDTFTLGPGESRNVTGQMRVPKGSVGGYYAVIACNGEPAPGGPADTGQPGVSAAISMRYQVNSVMMLTVPGANIQAKLIPGKPAMSADPKEQGFHFELPIANQGNIHSRLNGQVDISSEDGVVIDRIDLEAGRGFILPEHERTFSTKALINLPDGIYKANVRLTMMPLRRTVQSAFPFYVENGKPSMVEVSAADREELVKHSAGFTVTPGRTSIDVRSGGRRMQTVELTNLGRMPIEVVGHLHEWDRTAEKGDCVIDGVPSHGRSASKMLSLRNDTVVIRPMSKQRLQITGQLPAGSEGEYYAALTFERTDRTLSDDPCERTRRSVLIKLCSQRNLKPVGEIKSFEAKRQDSGIIDFPMVISNTGNVSFTPDVTIEIRGESNETIGKAKATDTPPDILAGSEGDYSMQWTGILKPGKYDATLTMRCDLKGEAIFKRIVFEMP